VKPCTPGWTRRPGKHEFEDHGRRPVSTECSVRSTRGSVRRQADQRIRAGAGAIAASTRCLRLPRRGPQPAGIFGPRPGARSVARTFPAGATAGLHVISLRSGGGQAGSQTGWRSCIRKDHGKKAPQRGFRGPTLSITPGPSDSIGHRGRVRPIRQRSGQRRDPRTIRNTGRLLARLAWSARPAVLTGLGPADGLPRRQPTRPRWPITAADRPDRDSVVCT